MEPGSDGADRTPGQGRRLLITQLVQFTQNNHLPIARWQRENRPPNLFDPRAARQIGVQVLLANRLGREFHRQSRPPSDQDPCDAVKIGGQRPEVRPISMRAPNQGEKHILGHFFGRVGTAGHVKCEPMDASLKSAVDVGESLLVASRHSPQQDVVRLGWGWDRQESVT